jgi:hypothetical protein
VLKILKEIEISNPSRRKNSNWQKVIIYSDS